MVMVVACEVVAFDVERVMDEKSRHRKNLFRTYRTIEREQSGSSDKREILLSNANPNIILSHSSSTPAKSFGNDKSTFLDRAEGIENAYPIFINQTQLHNFSGPGTEK